LQARGFSGKMIGGRKDFLETNPLHGESARDGDLSDNANHGEYLLPPAKFQSEIVDQEDAKPVTIGAHAKFVADWHNDRISSPVRIPDSFVLLLAIDALRFACRVIWRKPRTDRNQAISLALSISLDLPDRRGFRLPFEEFIEGIIAGIKEAARVPPCDRTGPQTIAQDQT
jgi:hypothetical protein